MTTDAELTASERESYRATIAALERELARYRERETHFAKALAVADGGQYRADWDGAIARVIAERDGVRRELALVRAERDTMDGMADWWHRAAERLSVDRAHAESRLTITEAARQGEQARAERYRGRLARLCRWVTPRVRPGWRGWGVWSRNVNAARDGE